MPIQTDSYGQCVTILYKQSDLKKEKKTLQILPRAMPNSYNVLQQIEEDCDELKGTSMTNCFIWGGAL